VSASPEMTSAESQAVRLLASLVMMRSSRASLHASRTNGRICSSEMPNSCIVSSSRLANMRGVSPAWKEMRPRLRVLSVTGTRCLAASLMSWNTCSGVAGGVSLSCRRVAASSVVCAHIQSAMRWLSLSVRGASSLIS